jgi:hypothetical protein
VISIYPNKLDGEPFEKHATNRRTTVGAWLDSIRKEGYKPGDYLPISVTVNDEIIEQGEWHDFAFRPRDDVKIFIEPKGTDPFSMAVAIFAGAKAIMGMLMPSLPGTPNSPGQGDSLSNGSAKGNKVKLGDVVRESFGTQRIYPDYLLPPHRIFTDARTQWIELMLCVGVGRFQIEASNIRIGDTPLLSLGADAEVRIYQPGEDVTSSAAATWWHQAPEVGSSSTGAAGLELTASTSITPNVQASALQFSGYTITIPTGAGTFPTDWTVGLVLRVVVPYSYTVTDGGGSARDVVTGPLSMLNPSVGNTIEVVGPNAGQYTVNSYASGQMTLDYSWGAPANQMTIGTSLAAIGPVGMRFKITGISPSVITVDRLTSSGSIDASFPGFTAATMSNATVSVDTSNSEGGWRGPFAACPQNEKTRAIQWEMFLPNGLCGIGKEGNIYSATVTYELQYRDMALGGAWTSVYRSYTNNTLDQIGATETEVLPYLMRPEVRVRKTFPLVQSLEVHNTIQWYGLKSKLDAPSSYPGCTTIAIRIRTSDRIAAQTENQISVIATRMLPTRFNGQWTAEVATNDIAPVFAYIAKSTSYTDSDIDLETLDDLDALWKARGDKFDMAYTGETTAKEALNNALGAGYAEITIDRGVITAVRDGPRTQLEHMYTPQNFTRDLVREIQLYSPNDFDGVDVTYTDGKSWTEEVIECRLPGSIGRKVEKIVATGVTDRTRAWRMGMRRLRTNLFRRDKYTWSTEMDALNSRYLSYDMVCDDVPGYGQSSLMLGYKVGAGSVEIESSEPLDWSAGGQHMLAVRRPNGTVSGPYVATRINDYKISVPSLDFSPDVSWTIEPPHLLFGPSNRLSYKVLVTGISPNGASAASVEAIGYNPEVYADDDNSPT